MGVDVLTSKYSSSFMRYSIAMTTLISLKVLLILEGWVTIVPIRAITISEVHVAPVADHDATEDRLQM